MSLSGVAGAVTLALCAVLLWLASSSDATTSRSAVMEATAYCLRGRTALGTTVRHGTVAVDPRVIRLGSSVHVRGYGYGRALDTGSAIKGYRVDVWMASCAAARQWGRRRVVVTW